MLSLGCYRTEEQLHITNYKGRACRAGRNKGQASVETLIVLCVLSLVFLFFFLAYGGREREVTWSTNLLSARRECYRVSELINRVRINGENFAEQTSFNDFTVKIYGNGGGIEILFDSDYAYCTFATSNVTLNGTDMAGNNFIFSLSGYYRLVNEGLNLTFYKLW